MSAPRDNIDLVDQIDFAIGALQAVKDETTHGLTANGEWMAKCLMIAMTRSVRALAILENGGGGWDAMSTPSARLR